MTDIQAYDPSHSIIHTMVQIASPHMTAVLVSDIQEIGKVIAHLVTGIMKSDGGGHTEFRAIGQQIIPWPNAARQLTGDRLNADIRIGGQSVRRYG